MNGVPYLEHPFIHGQGKIFTLHQISLEKVVDVDGESGCLRRGPRRI